MSHLLRDKRVGAYVNSFKCRFVYPISHADRPRSLHDDDVFIAGMGVRRTDETSIVVDPKDKWTGLTWITRYVLDPLVRQHLFQRNDLMTSDILRCCCTR